MHVFMLYGQGGMPVLDTGMQWPIIFALCRCRCHCRAFVTHHQSMFPLPSLRRRLCMRMFSCSW